MTFDPIGIVLQLVAVFYAGAGIVLARKVLMTWTVERAFAGIEGGGPSRAERVKAGWLAAGAFWMFSGAVFLGFLLGGALWLFVLSAVWQLAWLSVVAPEFVDREEAPDPDGRAQSKRAFVFYCLATGLIAAAAFDGKLRPWAEAGPLPVAMTGVLITAYGLYLATGFLWRTGK